MSRPSRIALVGFMGSGKSTVGRILAGRAGYRFADSDEEIESRTRTKVSEIFSGQGEAFFRDLERQAIRDLLSEEGCVIATGGGAFAEPASAEAILARAFTVHLHCDFEEAYRRVSHLGERPLFARGKEAAEALYADRKDKYSRAHASVDTTRRSADEVAAEVFCLVTQSCSP